jgi:ribosomal protein L29
MKLKDLRSKDLGELKTMLKKDQTEVVKLGLEESVRREKNVKKLFSLRRQIAVLSGMVSAREMLEGKTK